MKKVLLYLLFALVVISCDKNEMGVEDAGWFNDPGSSTGCSHNVIVYKSQYGYPLTLPDDFSLRAFGGVLVDNYYKDGYGYLVFDSDVTQIPESAFAGITSLTHILLPENCTTIGRYAFSNCKNMESVTIPASVTAMASNSFSNCYGELIVNCNIPDDMGWFSESMFSKITIGDSVEYVGYGAFSNCYYIENVDVGKNVITIASNAFSGSHLLEKFTGKYASEDNRCLIIDGVLTHFAHADITEYSIPSNVTTIGGYAFNRGGNLETISIPKSVTTIEASAFGNCSNLTGVYIEDMSTWCNVQFGNASANPLYYGHILYLNKDSVTDLTIPDSTSTISDYAFYNCKSLSTVTIHEQITEIRTDAFAGCSELTKVDVSNLSAWCQISLENPYANPLCHANHLYLNGNEVKELEIPTDIAEIKSYAFYNCSSFTKIILPENITTIGNNAFYDCSGELVVNSKIIESDNSDYYYINDWLYGTNFSKLTIGNSIVKIGNNVFYNYSSLRNVVIPASITSIGTDAFYNCANISKVDISDLSAWCKIDFNNKSSNPIYLGAELYHNGSKLAAIDIPSGVTKIEDYAFYNCSALTDVTIPASVTSIGTAAFYDCANISKVDISDLSAWCKIDFNNKSSNPIYLGAELYHNGSKLAAIDIPSGVTKIEDYAFYNCSALTDVTIPASVTSIGTDAFYDCANISKVDISDLSAWCKVSFSNNYSNPLCYSGELYIGGELANSIEFPENISNISSRAFYGCSNLTKVILPKNITSVGSYAFAYCTNLNNILCLSATPPYIYSNTLSSSSNLFIYVPTGCVNAYTNASGWSYYSSCIAEMPYTPTECTSLTITADNVDWTETSTTIYYTAVTNGTSTLYDKPLTDFTITGTAQSETFEQNTSETEPVERTISYTYLGQTATTTIIQAKKSPKSYKVNLNSEWRLSSSVSNPSSSTYDGVYESYSNYNINNSAAWMYIDITGYTEFSIYVRSNAEGTYDYVTVYNLDSTSSSKMNTSGKQNSGTTIGSYTKVTFTGIDGGSHRIAIKYSKDSSQNSGSDRGYVLIPKNQ